MDANLDNPYQAPVADLQAGGARAPLYRMSAVGIATFFGTPLAGAYIITRNLRALGREESCRGVWWISLGVLVAIMLVSYFLPTNAGGMGLTIGQVVGMHYYAKSLFGEAVTRHDGAFLSNWRAFGIALLFLLALIVVMFVAVLVFGFGEGEMTTLGAPVSVE